MILPLHRMMISSGFSSMLSFRLVKQYADVATLLPSQSGTEKTPLHVSLAVDAALRCIVTIAVIAIMASKRSPDGTTAANQMWLR